MGVAKNASDLVLGLGDRHTHSSHTLIKFYAFMFSYFCVCVVFYGGYLNGNKSQQPKVKSIMEHKCFDCINVILCCTL